MAKQRVDPKFRKTNMKFRTTILLIIFSFTLLLLWDEWISHNTKTLVLPESINADQTDTTALKENEFPSDLPSINKLDTEKIAWLIK